MTKEEIEWSLVECPHCGKSEAIPVVDIEKTKICDRCYLEYNTITYITCINCKFLKDEHIKNKYCPLYYNWNTKLVFRGVVLG